MGGGTPLVVNVTTTQDGDRFVHTMDKTWQEIKDSMPNVIAHVAISEDLEDDEYWKAILQVDSAIGTGISELENYGVTVYYVPSFKTFGCASPSDYPVNIEGGEDPVG